MSRKRFFGVKILLLVMILMIGSSVALGDGLQTGGRISFAAGATSAQVTGQVSGTTYVGYLLNAQAGQRMETELISFGHPVYLTVVSPGGSPLARAQAGAQSFDGTLPESGDYSLQVSAPSGTPQTGYTLITSVTHGEIQATQRISFLTGATAAQLTGQVDPNYPDNFVLGAFAGQAAQITLTSYSNTAYMTLVSPGGSPLARAQAGAQSYIGTLPENGDYSLQISEFSGAPQTSYTVNIVITGAIPPQPTPSGGTTQRISFAPGGTSATRNGQIGANVTYTYLLNARAGQYMQAVVSSSTGNVYLSVISPGGSPLARAQEGAQSYTGTLPENGDYKLQVTQFSGSLTNYSLYVSVTGGSSGGTAQRIQFAPGGTSATRSGQINANTTITYLAGARAGQYMQVTVSSPGNTVYLTVVSPFGSPLARAQAGAQSFAGTLPETGDYTIQVTQFSGSLTNYTLTVSIVG